MQDAGSSERRKPSSIEVAKNDQIGGARAPLDGRRSSSISGQSLFTAEDPSTPGSSEAGSQTALTSSIEVLRKTAHMQENIPPTPTRRRQSVDFTPRDSASTPESLKRTRSLWTSSQRRREGLDDPAGEFQDRYLRNFGTGTTMSERQRALNVKRARKMTQLFGQEPPPELIQIHDVREEEAESSRPSTSLSVMLSPSPSPLRDRVNSTSSTGTLNHDTEHDEVPSTSPPVSAITEETRASATAEDVSSAATFRDRRRRAAKLSRFFGVGFQDIGLSPELLTTPRSPGASVEVDVKVGRRFFGVFSEHRKEGDEMHEAIQKLRGLKAG
ncbi:hypothetical protein C8R45DRAFT_951794 [Mycena sanguinolenta]|nr:hypothetical protein C8R45DRAFT_951794 [Mycena sanguinolenta]